MDDQEARKIERKRQRNREAASKCRQKKLQKISELEALVQNEKEKSMKLDAELLMIRQKISIIEDHIHGDQKMGVR